MLAIDIFKTVSRKDAKIAKSAKAGQIPTTRLCVFAIFASLREKHLSTVFGLEDLVGAVDGEEFVGGAVDVQDWDLGY